MTADSIEILTNLPEIADAGVSLNAAGIPLPRYRWVLGWDGVVQMVVTTNDPIRHPFSAISGVPAPATHEVASYTTPLTGWAVFRVPATYQAERGWLFDEHGNVTPAEGRTRPLRHGESAGHQGSAA